MSESTSETEQVGNAFAAMLSTVIGSPVAMAAQPEKLRGGFWAQIWGVELTAAPAPFDRPMVLRVMPDQRGGLREAVVQQAIADHGFRTPRVFASGVAPGLGASYIVMERINGHTPLGGLRLGPELLALPRLLRRLPSILATTMSALHALNPDFMRAAVADAGAALPAPVHPFRSIIENADAECPPAGFAEFIRWLDEHAPTPGADVICHGDLHPLNILIDHQGMAWLLDWTNATTGPKEMDIGFTAGLLRCAPIAVPKPLRPIVQRITNRLAESFIQAVATTAVVDRPAVDWWEALQHGRCLAQVAHGRLHADDVVSANHPFEASVEAMRRRLHKLTGAMITPPPRVFV